MNHSVSRPVCIPVQEFWPIRASRIYYLSFQIARPHSSHSLTLIFNVYEDGLLSISKARVYRLWIQSLPFIFIFDIIYNHSLIFLLFLWKVWWSSMFVNIFPYVVHVSSYTRFRFGRLEYVRSYWRRLPSR